MAKSGFTVRRERRDRAHGAAGSASGRLPGLGSGYYASAIPLTLGSTGTRSFATNAQGTIWQNTAGTAPAEPFATAGTVAPIQ